MARQRGSASGQPTKKPDSYRHAGNRKNTPPAGLVSPANDPDLDPGKYRYYSDHDPNRAPVLVWAEKYESDDLSVPTVSLHQHERIDPSAIIEKILKKETHVQETLTDFFRDPSNDLPLHQTLEFYRHSNNWSNRFIVGDSLLVMNSLMRKEEMSGKVQMVYIDPPYGIKYGSNFQPFVCNTEVKDGKDSDLAYTPETIQAFRDTWELGPHSYLSYLRDRLVLARDLLTESGSCAVQISDENLHYVRMLMDAVFGVGNFVSLIPFRKTTSATSKHMPIVCDYIVWYAKDKDNLKYNKMYKEKPLPINDPNYRYLELKDGTRRSMNQTEYENLSNVPPGSRIYRHADITAPGESSEDDSVEFEGELFRPGTNLHWKVRVDGMYRLIEKDRIAKAGNTLRRILYFDESRHSEITNMWQDTTSGGFEGKIYAVQTTAATIRRFMLMVTDPGDLVLDPTCGSGTTAYVAEQYGRRWITCDTQRVAITLAKRRLMTSKFKYYKLRHKEQGISAGFSFSPPDGVSEKTTAKTLAYDEEPQRLILHDRPDEEKGKVRVSGPFTVEAVPAQTVMSIDAMYGENAESEPDAESAHQHEWRDALKSSGIRAKNGQKIDFVSVEPHPATRWLHARARTNEPEPKTAVISFGPQYAALGPKQVESALQDARKIRDVDMIVFAAMQFDPEASKTIDETDWEGVSMIKAQINADLLVGNLKKKPGKSSDLFILVGQPDVSMEKKGEKYKVAVKGFDYYDTGSGKIVSGGKDKIVMWMLDTDYDGRSLYPQQIFFPMAKGDKGGYWEKIAAALKDHIDWSLLQAYTGTESLEFELGEHRQAAVKIIDDRGIESLKILKPDED